MCISGDDMNLQLEESYMTNRLEVYKCEVCGNIVEVLYPGVGGLVCCNQPMGLQTENTTDAAQEKHVPVVNKTENGIQIRVGSVDHPMMDNHYIQWVELIQGEYLYRKYLAPGEEPGAIFTVPCGEMCSREFCNLHGHWMSCKEDPEGEDKECKL